MTYTDASPVGEVLDADTTELITKLGASLSKRASELAAENRELRKDRAYLRKELNERNILITGLRAEISRNAGSAEQVTILERRALPEPDGANPEHGNFVRDWVGEFTDEQLGYGADPDPVTVDTIGDIVREQILNLVDRIEAKAAGDARRAHDIEIITDLCGGDAFVAAQIVDALDPNEEL